MSILTSKISSANFNTFKDFFSKLWEIINLILSLILIFGLFVNTGTDARCSLLLRLYNGTAHFILV